VSLGEHHVGVHILGIQLTHELAAASAGWEHAAVTPHGDDLANAVFASSCHRSDSAVFGAKADAAGYVYADPHVDQTVTRPAARSRRQQVVCLPIRRGLTTARARSISSRSVIGWRPSMAKTFDGSVFTTDSAFVSIADRYYA
jgi:hypothetical protein